MKVHRFVAVDTADAVGQIRSRLGTDAVVLSVNQVRPEGVARLWSRPRLEVLAGLPESEGPSEPAVARPAGPRMAPTDPAPVEGNVDSVAPGVPGSAVPGGNWRSAAILQNLGLQPLQAEKVLERARATHGEAPPPSLAEEIVLIKGVLTSFWRSAPPIQGSPPIHVFVGPPGSGKTTTVCKWLAKVVLAEGKTARAWRLDSRGANFAGLLDVYGEILGVPVQRSWTGAQALTGCDVGYIDLPGVNGTDTAAMERLRAQVAAIPAPHVHLVLNAAYDIGVLLAQARAFATLPVTDLIFTHLDEEKRRGKLWNFVLGTNLTLRFLSGGQGIPGDFSLASPQLLTTR